MATITLHTNAHRRACLKGKHPDDVRCYNETAGDFFASLGKAAKAQWLTLAFDAADGNKIYDVDEDTAEAHEFMRKHDYWEWVQHSVLILEDGRFEVVG